MELSMEKPIQAWGFAYRMGVYMGKMDVSMGKWSDSKKICIFKRKK